MSDVYAGMKLADIRSESYKTTELLAKMHELLIRQTQLLGDIKTLLEDIANSEMMR